MLAFEIRAFDPPLVSFAGSLLSWIVMAAWWAGTAARAPVLPSLTVVAGLSLLMLVGRVWMRRQARPDDGPAQYYIETAEQYSKEPPKDWDGSFNLTSKG